MSEQEKLATGPFNPYLLNTFRAFLAESQSPELAARMTAAHVMHGQMAILDVQAKAMEAQAHALQRIAHTLDRIATLTDPVDLGRLLALIKAGDAKRDARAAERAADEAKGKLDSILKSEAS